MSQQNFRFEATKIEQNKKKSFEHTKKKKFFCVSNVKLIEALPDLPRHDFTERDNSPLFQALQAPDSLSLYIPNTQRAIMSHLFGFAHKFDAFRRVFFFSSIFSSMYANKAIDGVINRLLCVSVWLSNVARLSRKTTKDRQPFP